MSDYVVDFTGTADSTSPKPSFIIKRKTIDGPITPHSVLPVNTTATTTLKLPGRGIPNYGEMLAENQVFLLENFAATIPPVYPTSGQLWYDLTNNVIKVYDGVSWIAVQCAVGTLAPLTPNVGQLWFDTSVFILKVWNGGAWVGALSGFVPLDGSIAMTGPLTLPGAPTSALHAATKQYVDNKNALQTPFTPGGSVSAVNVQNAILELDSDKVARSGDTMVGFLTLNANPTASLHAATKQYVDLLISSGVSLSSLTDVFVSGISNQDLLSYDGINARWENKTFSAAGVAAAIHTHLATEINFLPAGNVTSVEVQSAIEELDVIKISKAGDSMSGVLSMSNFPIVGLPLPQTLSAATNKEYVDAADVDLRDVVATTPPGPSTYTTPPYAVNDNKLSVFYYDTTTLSNSRKFLAFTNGYQVANINRLGYSLSSTTGIDPVLNANTIYKASVAVGGVSPSPRLLRVKGSNAGTFADLFSAIEIGVVEDVSSYLSSNEIIIPNDYTDLFTITTMFQISGTPENDGVYAVLSSVFSAGFTTITISGTFATTTPTSNGTLTANGHNYSVITPIDTTNATPTNTFVIPGDYTALFVAGYEFRVIESTTNDGVYTVGALGSTYSLGFTTIPVTTSVTAPGINLGAIRSLMLTPAVQPSLYGRNIKLTNIAATGTTSTVAITDGPGPDNLFASITGFSGPFITSNGLNQDYAETTNQLSNDGYIINRNKWISTSINVITTTAAGFLEFISEGNY